MGFPMPPIFVQVLGVILGWYLLSASVFMMVVWQMWKKADKPQYLELIDRFEDDRAAAIRFGMTWPLTFTYIVLTCYFSNGTSFRDKFLDAAADHAEEILKQGDLK